MQLNLLKKKEKERKERKTTHRNNLYNKIADLFLFFNTLVPLSNFIGNQIQSVCGKC